MNDNIKNLTISASLFVSFIAYALFSTPAYSAHRFSGSPPVTPLDLICSPNILPNTPPKYTPHYPLAHKEYAHFAWRQFLYYNYPTKRSTPHLPSITPVVRAVIDSNNYDKVRYN
jgi:hypothetical protein